MDERTQARLDEIERWIRDAHKVIELLADDHRLRMMAGNGAMPMLPKYRQALERQQQAQREREARRRLRESMVCLPGGRA